MIWSHRKSRSSQASLPRPVTKLQPVSTASWTAPVMGLAQSVITAR